MPDKTTKKKIGVGNAYQPSLGRQLSRRVSSGAITQKQAKRTAGERRSLAGAYGPDWRQRVFGNFAGDLGSLRKSASEGDLGSKNELGVLLEKRKRLLDKAAGVAENEVAKGPTSTSEKGAFAKGPRFGGPKEGRPAKRSPLKPARIVKGTGTEGRNYLSRSYAKPKSTKRPPRKKKYPQQAPGPWYPGKIREEREGKLVYV